MTTRLQTVKTVAHNTAVKVGLVAKHFVLSHRPSMPQLRVSAVYRPDLGQYGVILHTKPDPVPFFKDGNFTPAIPAQA
jgi:hypothetical protein